MAEDVFGIVGSLQAAVFRVERVVAEGGFAVVYRAHHEGFKAAVALKCLKIPGSFSAAQRASFLQKFREEGELLFRLSALIPNVVRPLHVGTLEAAAQAFVPFIALEWLDGESLEQLIDRRRNAGKGPLDLARVARLMGPVARGLELAHAFPGPSNGTLSIVHCDLKPENLLLAKSHGQEALKILDFGIGKVRSAASQMAGRVSAEHSDLSAFTPAYGAPEQWLPKRYGQTGPWTDVWGFALCVVEALIGRAPLEGDAAAVMGACLDEQRRPTPGSFGVRVPERAEAALRKALAVEPGRRFHDIGKFWDEIEAVTGQRTPRITTGGDLGLDSVLPPGDLPGELSLGAGPRAFPALTLGLTPAALSDIERNAPPISRRQPSPPEPPEPRAEPRAEQPIELHLSVMPNNALEQLESAEAPRPPPRAPLPGLAVPERIARIRNVRALPSEAPTLGGVLARLLPALQLIGVGLSITIADVVYASVNGQAFTLGPVRALWIAGPLVGLGVVRLVLALVH